METETVNTTYTVTTSATETENGSGTYTTEPFGNSAFTAQTNTVVIPATGGGDAPAPGGDTPASGGGGGGGGGAAGGGEEIDEPQVPLAEFKPSIVGLNSVYHFAFVSGYPDGTVRPNNNITRYEAAVMLYSLLTDELKAKITTKEIRFPDVLPDQWYSVAVASLTNGGYIAGLPGGIYGGDREITRAEFIALLTGFQDWNGTATCTFADVDEDFWGYNQIGIAQTLGWVTGRGNNRFYPTSTITRAEAMTIINRVLGRGVDEHSDLRNIKLFSDNMDPNAWYYYEIVEASNSHDHKGTFPE